jgi:3-oxoacyl-[acyl-carrier-protein] synthase II
LQPSQIDYINAHASSTPMNDVTEGKAIMKVFGEKSPPISGTKSFYGHPLGATGAIEAVISLLAIEHQYIPPTLNCHELDPELPAGIDIVRNHGKAHKINYVLTNSFGFGGINSTLVLGKYHG